MFDLHYRGSSIAMDVARGLHFLHSNGVLHLDLKSANILLSRHGSAKIADVGMARLKDAIGVGTQISCGARLAGRAPIAGLNCHFAAESRRAGDEVLDSQLLTGTNFFC
jgi:serine/threonine protein kinase